ncbi:unnamed protein product [Closterium sp. NIES-65]|nr:unnamed protein product [Closterium sp. NIES-65]
MPNTPNQAPVPPSLLPATPSPTRVSLQLTEEWGERLFAALARAGGRAHNNMAVGYNNIDMDTATKHSINVGNTPGVLTETTAELAASLMLAAARRVVEADYFMRAGKYDGWLPTMFISNLLKVQTVGIISAGRIGSAYARMMVRWGGGGVGGMGDESMGDRGDKSRG